MKEAGTTRRVKQVALSQMTKSPRPGRDALFDLSPIGHDEDFADTALPEPGKDKLFEEDRVEIERCKYRHFVRGFTA
jgi:hypothetical protein